MPDIGLAVCTRCSQELQPSWRLCPGCGTPLDGATRTAYADSSPSSSGIEEGRFPAGIAGPVLAFVANLGWLWMLRRLGLLPVMIGFGVSVTRSMPFVLTGWLITRSVTLHAIPVVIAALALWAILSAQPRHLAEHAN